MSVSQEDVLYAKLNRLEIPTLGDSIEDHIQDMIEWIEAGHLTAFEIEQRMKQDDVDIQTLETLELKMKEIEKSIESCIEQAERPQQTIKLQSEWSSLKHFIHSLQQSIREHNLKREIRTWMASVLIGIDSLSWMIFHFYERRQQHLPLEDLLVEIDQAVAELFQGVERCYDRMRTDRLADEDLVRKHDVIQARWESIRLEIEELKRVLRQDRWRVVFAQVSDQVEAMMNALDRADRDAWETKYRHYMPSIDKMLAMLGNGIAARVSTEAATIARHDSLVRRWDRLRTTGTRSISPAGSETHRGSPIDRTLRSSPIARSVSEDRKVQRKTSRAEMAIERSQSDSRRPEDAKRPPRASPLRSPTVMTLRRAVTPSFIPRPKTPQTDLPARPHSSMTRRSALYPSKAETHSFF